MSSSSVFVISDSESSGDDVNMVVLPPPPPSLLPNNTQSLATLPDKPVLPNNAIHLPKRPSGPKSPNPSPTLPPKPQSLPPSRKHSPRPSIHQFHEDHPTPTIAESTEPFFREVLPDEGQTWTREYLNREYKERSPYILSEVVNDAMHRYKTKQTKVEVLSNPSVLLDAMGIHIIDVDRRRFGRSHRVYVATDRIRTCGDGKSELQAENTAQLHLLCLYWHYDLPIPNPRPEYKSHIGSFPDVEDHRELVEMDENHRELKMDDSEDHRDMDVDSVDQPLDAKEANLEDERKAEIVTAVVPNAIKTETPVENGGGGWAEIIQLVSAAAQQQPANHVAAYLTARFPQLATNDLYIRLFVDKCPLPAAVQAVLDKVRAPPDRVLESMPLEMRVQSWHVPGQVLPWRSVLALGPSPAVRPGWFVADSVCIDSSARAAILRAVVELNLV